MENGDRLIQGMAGGGDFRILAAQTTSTVETAREILDLSPVAADALGRALTGALLLARLRFSSAFPAFRRATLEAFTAS